MTVTLRRGLAGALAAIVILVAGAAAAQGLWYKEVERDGRIYVFNTLKKYEAWQKSGDMGVAITLIGHGPNGETVVAENETAIDLYNLKHDLPGYDREAPKPAPAALPPTSLRIGTEGELKFGMLLQGWYVGDTSRSSSSGTDWLGNNTGQNTFRLRRAEIKMNGKITPAWGFEVMFDPAKAISPQTSGTDGKILQDLAVIFTGIHGQEFALGQKKIYLTEEGVRSSSELWFGERAQMTRTFSDTRQTGFFYKGEITELFTLYSAITNGTPANTASNTNDTVNYTGRLDVRPVKGLVAGVSGLYGNFVGGTAHLNSSRVGLHAKYGGYDVPDSKLWLEAEWLWASTEQANLTNLKQDGAYFSALYLFGPGLQIGARYDWLNNDKSVSNKMSRMWTAGFHWLPKGKNLNLKLEWYNVHQDGRTVNGVSAQSYNEVLVAAQAAF